jgi:hypothetical protein
VLSFEDLDPVKVKELLIKYGEEDGIQKNDLENYFNLFKDKKYCLLIFIDKPELIKPFEIDKKGFGAMAAWLCVENIRQIRI